MFLLSYEANCLYLHYCYFFVDEMKTTPVQRMRATRDAVQQELCRDTTHPHLSLMSLLCPVPQIVKGLAKSTGDRGGDFKKRCWQ